MKTFLMIVLAIACIILIVSVLLQSGNSSGLSGSIAGGAEQLFGKKKSRGYEAILSGDSFRSSVGSIGYDRLDRLQSGQFLINYNIHL